MEKEQFGKLLKYRIAVGFLGEKEQFGWWNSSFFAPGSDSFLSPIFGRTQDLAKYHGVSQAASQVHDERIGVGNVYHLFRLPEDIEQGIHQILHQSEVQNSLPSIIVSKESAIEYLNRQAETPSELVVGPVRIGGNKYLRDVDHWQSAIGYYLLAFQNGLETYPYFSL